MKVTDLKINGISNPIGFDYEDIIVSWKVRDTFAKKQIMAAIEVSLDANFDELLYTKQGAELDSTGESLEFSLEPMTTYYYRVTVETDQGEKATSEVAYFETSKMNNEWTAEWIGTQKLDTFHPIFKKPFVTSEPITKAKLYVSGLGLYEAYINGEKVGNEYLTPLYSDYHTEYQYQTYDVTDYLAKDNTIEISLGNGWYKGRFGLRDLKENFGTEFACIAELHLFHADGSVQVIATDDTWVYVGSDIVMSDIYDGEVIDRTAWDQKQNPEKLVRIMDLDKNKLISRYSLPVIEKEEIVPKEIIHTPAGELVLDMGQNFTGIITFKNTFPKGTKLTFDFGEIMQQGNFYNENYRSAKSQFVYVSGGVEEVVRPHFTFFGFQYVRVTGWNKELSLTDIVGKVLYSDLETTGKIVTSDDKINQLFSNCLWGQKSNFLDFPTDCPQRDERLAWTGDAQVFAGTASYNMDTRAFYNKFIHDLRVEQKKHDGIISAYIPVFDQPIASSVWGDIGTFLPMVLYTHYGNKATLKKYFPMMKDWVDYITREDMKRGQRYLFDFGEQFGDWLAQDGRTPQSFKGGTDDFFIGSCYYYESIQLTAKAAGILGKEDVKEEYEALAAKVKEAIFNEYFTPSGRLSINTQTAYIVALNFGIYKNKEMIVDSLRERLFADGYKLTGGFVGAPVMCRVLAENGLEEEAYNFLFQETYPSWLYTVNLGATTIWERWNSVLADGTISGTMMNSLNHYAYGSIVEYLYRNVGGIKPLEPGFKKVAFAPQVNRKMKEFYAEYDSVSGKYVSSWKVQEDGSITFTFEVPFACTAEITLPLSGKEAFTVEAGVHTYFYWPTEDLSTIYTMKTKLSELMKDERVVEIIREKVPVVVELLSVDADDYGTYTLETLPKMHFMGVFPEVVDEIAAEVLQLKPVVLEMAHS